MRDASPDNPVLRLIRPRVVADVVLVRHALPGRLRLEVRRPDPAGFEAVMAALRAAGGAIEGTPRAPSLLVRYQPTAVAEPALLQAELPLLPLPPARLEEAEVVDAPVSAVWAALADPAGALAQAPDSVRVSPRPGSQPAWTVEVALAGRTLPHHLAVSRACPPRELELSVTGELNAVIRYDLQPADGEARSLLRQRLWFALEGKAAAKAIGQALVERFARRLARDTRAYLTARATAASGAGAAGATLRQIRQLERRTRRSS